MLSQVGVGCASAKEVVIAVEKAGYDAKRHVITVPITRGFTFPHRVNGIAGSAKVMLRPASEGTGMLLLVSSLWLVVSCGAHFIQPYSGHAHIISNLLRYQ